MKDIKLRFWNTDYKNPIMEYGSIRDLDKMYRAQDKNIMLSTGLQDVGGEDIYEGDIYNYGNNFIVRKGEYEFQNNLHIGFHFEEIPTGQIVPLTGYKRFTYVGNIYENPELLK